MAERERGYWVSDGESGLRRWSGGLTTWTDPHGASSVSYSLGRPVRVENVSLPDGTTVPYAETLSAVHRDVWRRPDGNGGFLLGRMLILEDSATFTFSPELDAAWKSDPAEDEDAFPIQRDLARDPEFMRRIQEDGFADAVYASFCNRDWRRADGERHSMSWRRSGGMVADLRRRGESYTDWYPHASAYDRTSAEIRDVEAVYARLDWTELTQAEAVADQELAATLLGEIEARPAGEPRPAARYRPHGVDERTDLYSRAYRAWESGRATDAEFGFVQDRIIHEDRSMTPEQFAALFTPKA